MMLPSSKVHQIAMLVKQQELIMKHCRDAANGTPPPLPTNQGRIFMRAAATHCCKHTLLIQSSLDRPSVKIFLKVVREIPYGRRFSK
jgi:hypothetical protein